MKEFDAILVDCGSFFALLPNSLKYRVGPRQTKAYERGVVQIRSSGLRSRKISVAHKNGGIFILLFPSLSAMSHRTDRSAWHASGCE